MRLLWGTGSEWDHHVSHAQGNPLLRTDCTPQELRNSSEEAVSGIAANSAHSNAEQTQDT